MPIEAPKPANSRPRRVSSTVTAKAVPFAVDDFVPRLVSSLTRYLHGTMTESIAQFRINIAEWRVLLCLVDGKNRSLNQVVQFTGLNQSSLSRAIGRIAAKGYITRTRHRTDARLVSIRITPVGRRVSLQATDAIRAACDRQLAILTPADRKKFVASIKALLASIPPPTRPSGFQY